MCDDRLDMLEKLGFEFVVMRRLFKGSQKTYYMTGNNDINDETNQEEEPSDGEDNEMDISKGSESGVTLVYGSKEDVPAVPEDVGDIHRVEGDVAKNSEFKKDIGSVGDKDDIALDCDELKEGVPAIYEPKKEALPEGIFPREELI